jgi:hypothetical protein
MCKPLKIYNLLSFFLVFIVFNASSQITSSPYSIFGLGCVEGNSIGATKAMGGTGIAFMSGHSINTLNPASYGGLDSLVNVFELGVFGKYTSYNTSNNSQSFFNANIKYVAMGFRVAPKLAISFGIIPYSTIGYNINTAAPIEGSNLEYLKTFSGEGGVNQFYLGGGYNITKDLVFGINAVYLFGTVTHSESSESLYYSLQDLTYLSNINLNYGLNYKFMVNSWKYNIGLIYDNGKALRTKNESTIITETETDVLKSHSYKYKIPQTFGIGLALEKDLFKIGMDYEMKKWKGIDFNNPLLETRNSNRYSFGVEFPSQGIRKRSSKMLFYRFGAEYCGSYLIIDKVPINYRSISFGAGLPVGGILNVINLSLELGQNGSKKEGLFKENFCTLHVDLSLKDHWFVKRKYD